MDITGLSISVDGFIPGAGDSLEQPLGIGGSRLFRWFEDGDTPSRRYPSFRMTSANAVFFDRFSDRIGAVITGRRTYDIARAWGGKGPLPGVPLFVLTHQPPADDPSTDPPYVFVPEGIERAIELAMAAAGDRDVSLMGSYAVRESLRAGLLDELTLDQVPLLLGHGVRLLDGFDEPIELELAGILDTPGVTHLTYRVVKVPIDRPIS